MLEREVAAQAGAIAPGAVGGELQTTAFDAANGLVLADTVGIDDEVDQVVDLPAVMSFSEGDCTKYQESAALPELAACKAA